MYNKNMFKCLLLLFTVFIITFSKIIHFFMFFYNTKTPVVLAVFREE